MTNEAFNFFWGFLLTGFFAYKEDIIEELFLRVDISDTDSHAEDRSESSILTSVDAVI